MLCIVFFRQHRCLANGVQCNAEDFVLAHIAAIVKLIERFIHVLRAEVGGVQFVVAHFNPLNGHAAGNGVMLLNVFEHFLQRISFVGARYGVKQKTLLVLGVYGYQIQSHGFVFLLIVKYQIVGI